MINTLLTHPGSAHKDDVLAICVLAARTGAPVVRRMPTAEDLADPGVAIVDVGGEHAPARRNYDHHHFPREHPPTCALSLVLEDLGLYQDALAFFPWLETAEWFDARGPNATAEHLGVPRRAVDQLSSPVDGTLRRRFSQLSELAPTEPLYQFMVMVGEDMLGAIDAIRARIARVEREGVRWSIPVGHETIEAMFLPRVEGDLAESGSLEDYIAHKGLGDTIHAMAYPDRRGSGYGLMRYEDHPQLDSARLARAQQHMPLGVAENYRFWGPDETVFIESMKGCTLTDFDGHSWVDFRLGYGPIILGYRDQRIDDAVIETLQTRGTTCGFSSDLECDVVERIKALCPWIEKVRFANSGTEAVIGAVRVARGYTGRERIIQVEGGFHGLFDEMMWKSDLDGWDDTGEPPVIPFGKGIPPASRSLSEFVPLNDTAALDAAFARHDGQIAAVILEPIQGNAGSIASTDAYLQHLRTTCDAHGALLIMDEVKTGFRVARGGAQALYGIHGDLTTYAKALGNGYPIACFGGRAEVMDVIDLSGGVVHGGTYTGNLIGLSAARATLDVLANTDALATVDRLGEEVMDVLGHAFASYDLEHRFAGPPSMFGVHLGDHVPQNYRDWKKTWSKLYERFAWGLIHRGLMLEPDSREPWFVCEAHRDLDLRWLDRVVRESLEEALEAE